MREQSAPAFIVIAEFEVKSNCLDQFLAAAREDATASVRDEPGCRQFDVLRSDGSNVVFYEVYDDRASFDRHLATPHLARFREQFPPLIVCELPVRFLFRHCAGAMLEGAI